MKPKYVAVNPKELLHSLHKKPGMYWGGGDYPFTSWIAFTSGLQFGYDAARNERGINPQDLVPKDFDKFVTERFGEEFPNGGGWRYFIRENTSTEQEAFDLFFQLREEYDRAHET